MKLSMLVTLLAAVAASSAHAQLGAPTTFPTSGGASPRSVCARDFDADGDVEVICAERTPHQIELFENDGTGTLASAAVIALPGAATFPNYAEAADVDNDGDLDIVVPAQGAAGGGDDFLLVFINTSPVGGPISFTASATTYATTNVDPSRTAVGDFNGDGFADVALSSFDLTTPDPNICVFLNTATGAEPFFGAPTLIPFPLATHCAASVDVRDLDGDGDLDMVVGAISVPQTDPTCLAIYSNDGAGTFTPTPGSPFDVNAGFGYGVDTVLRDFDGGAPDIGMLVFPDPFVATTFMDALTNAGGLVFAPFAGGAFGPGDANGNVRTTILSMDLDQDGINDVLGVIPSADVIRNWISDGAGAFPATGTNAAPAANSFLIDLDAGDLNGDNSPDVVAADNDTTTPATQVVVYLNTAPPINPPPAITSACPLAAGTVGVPYGPVTLTGAGGVPPYTWSVVGGLPPGVVLDPLTGVLSGTPTAAGTFPFTIVITDADFATDNTACSITIATAPPPPPPPGGGGGGGGGRVNTRNGHGSSGWLPCGAGVPASGAGRLGLLVLAAALVLLRRRA